MSRVFRIYVKKREEFAVEAKEVLENLKVQLKLENLENIDIINRYDVEGISEEVLITGINTILSEPMVDDVYVEDYPSKGTVFAIEFLPGQYDQRADACEQCFSILTGANDVKVKCAKVYDVTGNITGSDLERIQKFLINPVDQRLASLDKPESLKDATTDIPLVPTIEGFIHYSDDELKEYIKANGMAMNFDDLKISQDYFRDEEHRNPTETELKVLDTYWSDHCRHTTFATIIDDIEIENGTLWCRHKTSINVNGSCDYINEGIKKTRVS